MINTIIRFKKSVAIVFLILSVISSIAFLFVDVNYNMQDYLPEEAESTIALNVMEEEFSSGVPNTRVMIEDVTIQEAINYKDELISIDGVTEVLWLDDVVDLRTPIEVADTSTVESYYKDGKALFSVTIESGKEVEATDRIYALIGDKNAISGEAVNTAAQQKMTGKETLYAAALLVPIIIIILVLSTNSWVEPVFFLTAIGVSVLINLGTNVFIGEVSFVTQSVAPILQLAVSLDYAIFLLHSFQDYRNKGYKPNEAMKRAMKESFPVISSSALTTFFGFTALMFMDFEIGSDLGLNLVKGIVLSFISVMVFLPALTLLFYRWIEKTEHRPLIPPFKGVGEKLLKLKFPAIALVVVMIVPSFLAQNSTAFTYGMGEQPENTRLGTDIKKIEEIFGESTSIVLLVPNDDVGKEQEMIEVIEEMNHVSAVVGYANMIGSTIPHDYLEDTMTDQFLSENFSRMIINTDAGTEGELPFSIVENVREVSSAYYGEAALTLGESVALFDMKETVTKDNQLVNILTVATIGMVLLLSFRSISIPVILLLTIQSAVWINLAVPYFTDTPLVFIGYLIVSTVQLAATVDYAILLTETYKHYRQDMAALPAIQKTIDDKLFSIAVSASILSSVGFILWMTSSNPIVGSIGLLLGRGALLAFILVITFLPALLLIGDKTIQKTSLRMNFYKGDKHEDN
ncbi:efflux RND transporter permease subunit [Cytobacillus horneckiae]|uniref:RND transporter n=1 Tax=Cytobacillus horneckiae TaxID=549687 RepID=A0A2N0ZJL7_9BACI|nr:MMPL family transporter [Cytobacillus horneckiae]MEC1158905.1 MMPL family transporter [Cytobacillus horneckiae]MED2938674.1 MMPL family transporter [Cytobacillus horneckiae]PKG29720.1 RND transporter [Cytobacillus horneckiae]